jgi:hypothetical protein
LPFQGASSCYCFSQGGALGWIIPTPVGEADLGPDLISRQPSFHPTKPPATANVQTSVSRKGQAENSPKFQLGDRRTIQTPSRTVDVMPPSSWGRWGEAPAEPIRCGPGARNRPGRASPQHIQLAHLGLLGTHVGRRACRLSWRSSRWKVTTSTRAGQDGSWSTEWRMRLRISGINR